MEQLNNIDLKSNSIIQVIFKHSTRCSISNMAKKILIREMKDSNDLNIDIYYLDIINFRDISNNISIRYNVKHESPQILIIKGSKCIYHASHSDISLEKTLWQ